MEKTRSQRTLIGRNKNLGGERRLGIRLRRARGLMGRAEGKNSWLLYNSNVCLRASVKLNTFITVGRPFKSE